MNYNDPLSKASNRMLAALMSSCYGLVHAILSLHLVITVLTASHIQHYHYIWHFSSSGSGVEFLRPVGNTDAPDTYSEREGTQA